jgi:hypothetical protein
MNAEVTMPIAQLDELRDSLKKSLEENKRLLENTSKIELTVNLKEQVRDYEKEQREYDAAKWNNHGGPLQTRVEYMVVNRWDGVLESIPTTTRFKMQTKEISHSFENMSQFMDPLIDIAREKVRTELDQAERVASTAVQDLAIAKGEFATKKAAMIESFDKEIYDLTKTHKGIIAGMNDEAELLKREIKELKNEAINLSKDERISIVESDLEAILATINTFNNYSTWNRFKNSIQIPELKSTKKK